MALLLVGSWPAVVRALHARGITSAFSPAGTWIGRARATEAGMAPYLHVLVLAVPLAVVGGLLLSPVRRRIGAANDGWAWAGLAWGLVAVAGALVTGTGAIGPWILSTVHRVTEFPILDSVVDRRGLGGGGQRGAARAWPRVAPSRSAADR